MNDVHLFRNNQEISDKGKHRLRIAARFLRQRGFRFDSADFYQQVIKTIAGLDQVSQEHLRGLVDWIEEYEISEREIFGEPARSRARKRKNYAGRKRALRVGVSDARPE